MHFFLFRREQGRHRDVLVQARLFQHGAQHVHQDAVFPTQRAACKRLFRPGRFAKLPYQLPHEV